jgi:hypothetical protein
VQLYGRPSPVQSAPRRLVTTTSVVPVAFSPVELSSQADWISRVRRSSFGACFRPFCRFFDTGPGDLGCCSLWRYCNPSTARSLSLSQFGCRIV